MTAGPQTPVVRAPFSPSADRRSVLDRAHRGDIEGALGRVRSFDTGPRLTLGSSARNPARDHGARARSSWRPTTTPGRSRCYAQSGQDYGLRLLWPFVLLGPVLFVNQEMVARLGAVTGAGHARLIFERFGRRWGTFALGDLLALNVLTIVTEFIGINLALSYFGVSRWVSVPIAGLVLIAMTATGRFRRWEQMMYVLVAANVLVIPLVAAKPSAPSRRRAVAGPGDPGRIRATGVLFLIALVGTTVSPWQLFFQQSNVVDKRITARWLGYERLDTLIGTLLFLAAGVAIVVTCAFAFDGTPLHGAFNNAGTVARLLEHRLGSPAGALFALALFNASILGAAVVTLTTSYAVGDVLGTKNSLHRGWRDAHVFHASFAARDRAGGRSRADPGGAARDDHDGGAGARGCSASQRHGLPPAALQRPRRPRPAYEPALAQRSHHSDRRRPSRPLRASDHGDAPAEPQRDQGGDRPCGHPRRRARAPCVDDAPRPPVA